MTTFEALEVQRHELLADVGAWTPAQLAYRPSPRAWSAPEVLDHLVRAEAGILAAARDGVRAPHRVGVRDRAGFAFIDWLFRSDRRVRVPASAAGVLPDSAADLAGVRRRWDATRAELGAFLAPLAPEQLGRGVFRHAVSGWMTVPQVLRFFEVHAHHHGFQLARLRADAGVR